MNQNKIEFIIEAYKNTQNMISFADAKANTSLSIQSLLISIGLGTSLLSNTFDNVQQINNENIYYLFYTIVIILIMASIIGILLSICVYKSRTPLDKNEQNREGLLYFGHIAQFPSFEEFSSKINNVDDAGILNEFSHQVYHLSHIAKKKMEFVNISIYFLILNLCLTIFLIILSGYISTIVILET